MHPIGRDTLNEPSMSLRKGAMRCVVIRLQPHRIWNSHSLADWIHTLISSPLLSLFLSHSLSLFLFSLVSLFTPPKSSFCFPHPLGRLFQIIRLLPSPLASRAALLQSWNHLVKQPAKATLMLRLDKDIRIPTISG